MDISKRLKTIAGMAEKDSVVCDVGTDHGYLAIYLVDRKLAKKVIAMDVAKGPLSKAQANIALYHCEDRIETRLSDGLDKLMPNEASTVIMAGMGGILITSLLEKGKEVMDSVRELIVSPHTDAELVRRYLLQNGYAIVQEKMVVEEGKYYIILKAVHGRESYEKIWEYRYGRLLLESENPVLKEYLEKELGKCERLKNDLEEIQTENSLKRRKELEEEIYIIKEGLKYYEMQGSH